MRKQSEINAHQLQNSIRKTKLESRWTMTIRKHKKRTRKAKTKGIQKELIKKKKDKKGKAQGEKENSTRNMHKHEKQVGDKRWHN